MEMERNEMKQKLPVCYSSMHFDFVFEPFKYLEHKEWGIWWLRAGTYSECYKKMLHFADVCLGV